MVYVFEWSLAGTSEMLIQLVCVVSGPAPFSRAFTREKERKRERAREGEFAIPNLRIILFEVLIRAPVCLTCKINTVPFKGGTAPYGRMVLLIYRNFLKLFLKGSLEKKRGKKHPQKSEGRTD